MKANQLNTSKVKGSIRVGRGISAGRGKTAGRGTKGQNARAGGSRRPGFEGGQTPFAQRLPKKRGFTSHRPKQQVVYTGQLNVLEGTVNVVSLFEAGYIAHPFQSVKVIAKGELSKKLRVELAGASASAVEMINKAGGSFEQTKPPLREAKTK